MRRPVATLLVLGVTLLITAQARAEGEKVIVITLGGLSTTDVHGVAKETAKASGYEMELDKNWAKYKGDAVASQKDAETVLARINELVARNGGKKSELNLVILGKSAGGVLGWNTFRVMYAELREFHRIALVTVDPHGSVKDDDNTGPYCDRQELYWPGVWSSDKAYFRVYNIYQHEKGLTGASFPDARVHRNVRISQGVSHDSITTHAATAKLIGEALDFVFKRK